MSASEKSETKASRSEVRPRSYAPVAGVSMRDLLAAGVAASVISTPPREPDAGAGQSVERHREAA
ncbi:hypothetical protein [Streptomyces sp. HD]|uniref:hypothetical protein n=1 Tax=Streptomyces sp. HD TaxID=3020892 RepID=UPI00232D1255|nr:hypothetical protein [Streptomyces sp. HD]MDC0765780.1 hypothetical protein [Streptomyces sp. HD]